MDTSSKEILLQFYKHCDIKIEIKEKLSDSVIEKIEDIYLNHSTNEFCVFIPQKFMATAVIVKVNETLLMEDHELDLEALSSGQVFIRHDLDIKPDPYLRGIFLRLKPEDLLYAFRKSDFLFKCPSRDFKIMINQTVGRRY